MKRIFSIALLFIGFTSFAQMPVLTQNGVLVDTSVITQKVKDSLVSIRAQLTKKKPINTIISLSDSASVIWDYSKGNIADVTITSSRDLILKNVCEGCEGILYVAQSAAGGYSLNNISLKLSAGTNEVDRLRFVNKGGVLWWSVDNFGVVPYDSTGSAVIIVPPVGVPDIVFSTVNNIAVASTIWSPTANIGGTVWGQTGLSSTAIPANTDGYIRMSIINTSSKFGMLGFKVANSIGGYATFDIAMWAGGNPTYLMAVIDGGTIKGNQFAYPASSMARIFRKGSTGVFTCETSVDSGATWTVQYTYTFTSTAQLYIVTDIRGDGQLFTPKYFF